MNHFFYNWQMIFHYLNFLYLLILYYYFDLISYNLIITLFFVEEFIFTSKFLNYQLTHLFLLEGHLLHNIVLVFISSGKQLQQENYN